MNSFYEWLPCSRRPVTLNVRHHTTSRSSANYPYDMSKRYSLRRLFALTTMVAAGLSVLFFVRENRLLRGRLLSMGIEKSNQEKASSADRARDLESFWGAKADPILVIDLPTQTPILYEIKNSKFTSVQRSHYLDSDQKIPSFSIDLRLLRSLDGIDYYRLRYSAAIAKSPPAEIVFPYDGTANVIVQNSAIFLAIAPSREDSLLILSRNYERSTFEAKLADWSAGTQVAPIVETPFWPSLGRPIK